MAKCLAKYNQFGHKMNYGCDALFHEDDAFNSSKCASAKEACRHHIPVWDEFDEWVVEVRYGKVHTDQK